MKSALETVYLDNSATTRVYKESAALATDVMCNSYGNPSSLHRKGIEAEKLVKKAREQIAKTINASPAEIFFTSGGTEADNLAIIGGCGANRGRHIISSNIEHPAVMSALQYMEKKGYSVEYAPVNKKGEVDIDRFSKMLSKNTALVSCMLVNNELGTIEPVKKMGKLLRNANPSAVFHIDAVQGYGKVPIDVSVLDADFVSLSSHKIHGPKGVGALYIRNKSKITPIQFGGGQQNGIRPGTENVPGIAAFGLSAELCHKNISEKVKKMEYLKNRLKTGILKNIDDVLINTPDEGSAPHILNVSFAYVKSEVLLHSLESDGIYVSSGSACSSHKNGPSYVLTAIGVDRKMIDGSIRFSLSEFTTQEEIDYTIGKLMENVKNIRKLMKR